MFNKMARMLELSFAVSLELAKLFKFGFYIVGSRAAFFSFSQAIAPISGLFCKTSSNIIIFFIRSVITLFLTNFGLLTSLLYHIPTFCGALYFSSNSKLLKVAIPTICILLFITHPTGSQAYVYSFYWFIPIALTILNTQSILSKSLGSTFTAHAVGSIIWLYTHQMSVSTWNSLIAVVWLERLMFALTLTVGYYSIVKLRKIIENRSSYEQYLPNFLN